MEKKDFPEASAVFLLSLLALSYIFAAALTPYCVADSNVRIQLCMIIDGSGSINNTEWTIITNAVAEAVNETIPHDSHAQQVCSFVEGTMSRCGYDYFAVCFFREFLGSPQSQKVSFGAACDYVSGGLWI